MKYWNKRLQGRIDLLEKSIDELDNLLAKDYKIALRNIKANILDLYAEIEAKEGKVLASHLYQYNKYYELLNNLDQELIKLGLKEKTLLEQKFIQLYKDNESLLNIDYNIQTNIPDELVKEAVNSIWCADGKSWSERVWTNTAALRTQLEEGLVEIFATGKSPADLNRLIQEKFDVSFTNADRLIRTEMSYIQNRSTIDKYKQAGITHYRILSTSDSCHTCADESLVHNIDKAITGVNLPPLHPNCKCTILAVMED